MTVCHLHYAISEQQNNDDGVDSSDLMNLDSDCIDTDYVDTDCVSTNCINTDCIKTN
jgi:hypothetical protein